MSEQPRSQAALSALLAAGAAAFVQMEEPAEIGPFEAYRRRPTEL